MHHGLQEQPLPQRKLFSKYFKTFEHNSKAGLWLLWYTQKSGITLYTVYKNWSHLIGHFRITSGFFFEPSLGAHPFIFKSIFIHTQIKLIFMWMKIDFAYEKISTRTRFEKEARGNTEWPIGFCVGFGLAWLLTETALVLFSESFSKKKPLFFHLPAFRTSLMPQ